VLCTTITHHHVHAHNTDVLGVAGVGWGILSVFACFSYLQPVRFVVSFCTFLCIFLSFVFSLAIGTSARQNDHGKSLSKMTDYVLNLSGTYISDIFNENTS